MRPELLVRVEHDGKDVNHIPEAPNEFLNEREVVVAITISERWTDKRQKIKASRPPKSEAGRKYGLLDEIVYGELEDLSQSRFLILDRIYLQELVCSGRIEAQTGRGKGQDKVEKSGGGKSTLEHAKTNLAKPKPR